MRNVLLHRDAPGDQTAQTFGEELLLPQGRDEGEFVFRLRGVADGVEDGLAERIEPRAGGGGEGDGAIRGVGDWGQIGFVGDDKMTALGRSTAIWVDQPSRSSSARTTY